MLTQLVVRESLEQALQYPQGISLSVQHPEERDTGLHALKCHQSTFLDLNPLTSLQGHQNVSSQNLHTSSPFGSTHPLPILKPLKPTVPALVHPVLKTAWQGMGSLDSPFLWDPRFLGGHGTPASWEAKLCSSLLLVRSCLMEDCKPGLSARLPCSLRSWVQEHERFLVSSLPGI